MKMIFKWKKEKRKRIWWYWWVGVWKRIWKWIRSKGKVYKEYDNDEDNNLKMEGENKLEENF